MSAPREINTGSWNRLSGVRFSWKMITMCWMTAAIASCSVRGPLLGAR